MKRSSKDKLGEREMDIMQALWRSGTATVSEVHQSLTNEGHEIAYTTVQTMLNRLETKGLVTRDGSDRAHRYRPLLKQPAVVNSAIKKLAERFFSGSVEALAVRLVERDLSPEQLDRMQQLIEEQRRRAATK